MPPCPSRHFPRVIGLLAACAFSFASVANSNAAPYVTFQMQPTVDVFLPGVNDTVFNPVGLQFRQAGGSSEKGSANASGSGFSQYGVLKARSTSNSTGESGAYARTQAAVGDIVRFNRPADPLGMVPARAEIFLDFDRSLTFNGSRAIDGLGYAFARVGFSMFGSAFTYNEQLAGCLSPNPCAPFVQQQTTVTNVAAAWLTPSRLKLLVPIEWDADTSLDLTLDAVAYGFYDDLNATRIWTADAGNSLYWGGLTRLLDEQGSSIDFTMTSASGTDYRMSFTPDTVEVPLPPGFLLMAFGLGVIATRLSRRPG